MNTALFNLPELLIEKTEISNHKVSIMAHCQPNAANCPQCGVLSSRIHSYYTRKGNDLPISGQPTVLRVVARRFRCMNANCHKPTFVERLACLPFKAQRTSRLTRTLQAVAFRLGGQAGSRLTAQLQMPTSADTLIRLMRKWSLPAPSTPRIIGVDDWAMRKRVTYGTIIVDLETHQPIELLEDRSSATLKAWLLDHEGVEVIARDRSSEYALGAKQGAPQAVQVADRFHLLQNLKQLLDRLLTNQYQHLKPLLMATENGQTQQSATPRLLFSIRDISTNEKTASNISRQRRLETYQQVKQLQTAGWKIGQMARRLDINPTTVRKYFYAETFPERNRRAASRSILNSYLAYLEARFGEGCRNALQLWREIKEKGYPGSHRQVSKWLSKRRQGAQWDTDNDAARSRSGISSSAALSPPARDELPSARQLAWLMMRPAEQLQEEERESLLRIQQDGAMRQVYELAQQFIQLVQTRKPERLDAWLQACKVAEIPMMQSFATRIEQDYAAVRAALETEWSNGQTEGQVNRLKLLKRQMYGRTKFDLLRQRVLYAA